MKTAKTTAAEFAERFCLSVEDVEALCERHDVAPDDLDGIPHPGDEPLVYVSYGPSDDDVETLACVEL